MKRNDRRSRGLDQRGFTLVEVMVALVIFLMASQMMIAGLFSAFRMMKRAEDLRILSFEMARDPEKVSIWTDGVGGRFRLELEDGTEIVRDGEMYRYEDSNGTWSVHVPVVETETEWEVADIEAMNLEAADTEAMNLESPE